MSEGHSCFVVIILSLTPLPHSSPSLLSLTPLPHPSPSLLSLTPLPHSSASLLCLTPLPHPSPLSLTPLPHPSPSLLSLTPLPHTSPTLLSLTPLPHPLVHKAVSLRLHPLYLMIPVTVASSFAFMLPIATPPNAIAFSYKYIKVFDMVGVWVCV